MAFINDLVFDNGLQVLTDDVDGLYICSQQPTTYAEASNTYALGTKASPTVSSPQNGAVSGRRVTVSAITDGSVTDDGTATHWALTDSGNSRLLAAGSLSPTQNVANGNTFTLTEFSVTIPDAA